MESSFSSILSTSYIFVYISSSVSDFAPLSMFWVCIPSWAESVLSETDIGSNIYRIRSRTSIKREWFKLSSRTSPLASFFWNQSAQRFLNTIALRRRWRINRRTFTDGFRLAIQSAASVVWPWSYIAWLEWLSHRLQISLPHEPSCDLSLSIDTREVMMKADTSGSGHIFAPFLRATWKLGWCLLYSVCECWKGKMAA